jgi:hypothetical protein
MSRDLSKPREQREFLMSVWQPDEAAKSCLRCGAEFGFTQRRHHCRHCGLIYCVQCASCTAHGELLPPRHRRREFRTDSREQTVVRLCTGCDEALAGFCAALRLGAPLEAERYLDSETGLQGRLWPYGKDPNGWTFAHMAVYSGSHQARAPPCPHAYPAFPGALAPTRRTLLLGTEQTLRWVLSRCAAPPLLAAKDRSGRTPLALAARAGHLEQVRLLVQECGRSVVEMTDAKLLPMVLDAVLQRWPAHAPLESVDWKQARAARPQPDRATPPS